MNRILALGDELFVLLGEGLDVRAEDREALSLVGGRLVLPRVLRLELLEGRAVVDLQVGQG